MPPSASNVVAAARLSRISNHLRLHSMSTPSPITSSLSPSAINKMSGNGNGTQTYSRKHKVAIIGSGNWGSAICKILAENTTENSNLFESEVRMWVYEEMFQLPSTHKAYDASKHAEPVKLTTLINTLHENVKYLPGIALPHNIVADPSLPSTVAEATLIIFNVPHQFINNVCNQLEGKILPYARAISCIKGVEVSGEGVSLFSDVIGRRLGTYCGALSGANIASEVAEEKFCETTIAYAPPAELAKDCPEDLHPINHKLWKSLFHRPYFHVHMVDDVVGVSLGGALKNVVALAAGFVDGMGWGNNAKSAIMRVGLLEMRKFGLMFFDSCKASTFTEESAGVADLITSCAGGRNHKCAKLSVELGKPIEEIEKEVLNGQRLQGNSTAYEVNEFLKKRGLEKEFPLFTAVYKILEGTEDVKNIPNLIHKVDEVTMHI